ncbi:MAG: peptidoglycan DD-metalloendopeptidase family protein [Saprospiraceae bacterium]|nr:peptidoglycan DD-metalloendopeptidase family protein [Saprospiraceae bacterium]
MNSGSTVIFCFFLLLTSFVTQAQDPFDEPTTVVEKSAIVDTLPELDTFNHTSEYELIILDGDTLLRSNITNELYNRNFSKVDPISKTVVARDVFSANWSTTEFNPYKNEIISYPIAIDFRNERFTMPIDGLITSRYGWRRGRAHRGIDIDLVTGDNVRAAMDGKVRFAKYYGGLGRVVVIRHNNGLETIYAHLSKILVKPNDYVISGQVIGKGGNTGKSRGSHLHFEARYKNQAIHPDYLFDFDKKKNFNNLYLLVDNRWADPAKHRAYKKSNIVLNTGQAPLMAVNNPLPPAATPPPIAVSDSGQSISAGQTLPLVEKKYHVIAKGDTLYKISKKYNISIKDLCSFNGIEKSTILKIGKRLLVE